VEFGSLVVVVVVFIGFGHGFGLSPWGVLG